MISAAITPGIQPQTVRIKTIITEPQPLSITAKGGKRIDSSTLHKLIQKQIYDYYFLFKVLLFGIALKIDSSVDI